jgi:hypothetical protein
VVSVGGTKNQHKLFNHNVLSKIQFAIPIFHKLDSLPGIDSKKTKISKKVREIFRF